MAMTKDDNRRPGPPALSSCNIRIRIRIVTQLQLQLHLQLLSIFPGSRKSCIHWQRLHVTQSIPSFSLGRVLIPPSRYLPPAVLSFQTYAKLMLPTL